MRLDVERMSVVKLLFLMLDVLPGCVIFSNHNVALVFPPSSSLLVPRTIETLIGGLLLQPCGCKCETSVLSSSRITEQQILELDSLPWGARIFTGVAGMLGFHLKGVGVIAPIYLIKNATTVTQVVGEELLVLLEGRESYQKEGFTICEELQVKRIPRGKWVDLNASKALAAMRKRFCAAVSLNCLCPRRAVFFSSYLHSCGFYVRSMVSCRDPNVRLIKSMMSKIVLKRLWVQAKDLPGTFHLLAIHCFASPRTQAVISQISLDGRASGYWSGFIKIILENASNPLLFC